jgi:hypothetical protein
MISGVVGAKCISGRVCATSIKALVHNLAAPSNYSANAMANVTIQPPAVILYPTVVLSLPTELSACNSLTVDLSASTGAGGRLWMAVVFAVKATNGDVTLAPYLNTNYNSITNTVVVPRVILASGTFEITVAVENFFGNTAYKTGSVTVTGRKHFYNVVAK